MLNRSQLWRSVLVVALLAVASGPAAALGSQASLAVPSAVRPATGVGHIRVYSSPHIHFGTGLVGTGLVAGPDGALWFTNSINVGDTNLYVVAIDVDASGDFRSDG